MLKVFKIQTTAHYIDIQQLNHYANALKNSSPLAAESLMPEVRELHDRWTILLADIGEREVLDIKQFDKLSSLLRNCALFQCYMLYTLLLQILKVNEVFRC